MNEEINAMHGLEDLAEVVNRINTDSVSMSHLLQRDKALEGQLAKLRSDLNHECSRTNAVLRKLSQSTTRVTELEQSRLELQLELKSGRSEIQRLKAALEDALSENGRLRGDLSRCAKDSGETIRLREDSRVSASALSETEQQVSDLKEELDCMRLEMDARSAELLTRELIFKKDLDAAKSEVEIAKANAEESRARVSVVHTAELGRLRGLVAELEGNNYRLASQVSKLQNSESELSHLLATVTSERNRSEAHLKDTEQESRATIRQLQVKVRESSLQLDSLTLENARLKSACARRYEEDSHREDKREDPVDTNMRMVMDEMNRLREINSHLIDQRINSLHVN